MIPLRPWGRRGQVRWGVSNLPINPLERDEFGWAHGCAGLPDRKENGTAKDAKDAKGSGAEQGEDNAFDN